MYSAYKNEKSFSIGDGGLVFTIEDSGRGPKITILNRHWGNCTQTSEYLVEPIVLQELSDMFAEAAQQSYSKTYSYAVGSSASRDNSDLAESENYNGFEDDYLDD